MYGLVVHAEHTAQSGTPYDAAEVVNYAFDTYMPTTTLDQNGGTHAVSKSLRWEGVAEWKLTIAT